MIKSSAMFSAHALHLLLRNTLISLIVIFIALFFWLKIGIEADTLVVGNYKIEKLYLKLDKKLTLKAKNIVIPKSKENPSFIKIDKVFDEIKYLFTFFDTIALDNIVFDNNHYSFAFQNNMLYITSDSYEISGSIERVNTLLTAKISKLHIKKENILLYGNLNYDLTTEYLSVNGNYDAYGIKGSFIAHKRKKHVDFKVSSERFDNLHTLIDTIPMNPTIKAWIVDKVQAKHYTLHALEGEGTIEESGFKMNFDSLTANILFEDVKIFYKEGLEPILANNFTLRYKQKALYFNLLNPTYKGRSLDKSKIAITHLGAKAMLLLDLHIQSKIDNTLQEVLQAYKLNIPVKHKGKVSQLSIQLDIPLGKKEKAKKRKIAVRVKVDVSKGKVWYKDIGLPVKKASVLYDNSLKEPIVVDAVLQKGIVNIGNVTLPVVSGEGQYTEGTVHLSDVHLKSLWYDTRVNGSISLVDKNADLLLKVKKLTLGDKEKFIVLENKTLPLKLNYAKKVKATVKSLDLTLVTDKNKMTIALDSLKKIKPYVRKIGIDFDDGSLNIIKKGKETYTFKGILRRKKCFFYDKDNLCYTKVPYRGTVSKKGLDFYAFNDRLHFTASKSRLKLKNINIDLKKLLENMNQKQKSSKKKLVILGKKSTLRYSKYKLLTDSYDIEISPKGTIQAAGSLDGDIVHFSKKGKKIALNALRVKDKMLHPLIGFTGLKEGRYTLTLSGTPEKMMKGQMIIEGGIMSGFKAYNNTLAFINALPAIATLSNPGFSEKGFKILEGVAEYKVKGSNHFVFDSIYIKGESATIVGKGEIDIKKNTIDMKLAIQTARELGKIVGNLPLFGYILMGKDKSMTVGLEITGSLTKPIVNTSATQEILTLPLELIKRTLESPAHIINK